jgi:hypothetical protein
MTSVRGGSFELPLTGRDKDASRLSWRLYTATNEGEMSIKGLDLREKIPTRGSVTWASSGLHAGGGWRPVGDH